MINVAGRITSRGSFAQSPQIVALGFLDGVVIRHNNLRGEHLVILVTYLQQNRLVGDHRCHGQYVVVDAIKLEKQ